MRFVVLAAGVLATSGCAGPAPSTPPQQPSILLVTLDTTRADAIGPGAKGIETPAFNALAARGLRFTRAYATAPETLPSHTSMLSGLYPAGHGVHENARSVPATVTLAAERLKQAGYRTEAIVSSFPLARRFGLARGFDVYDDTLPGDRVERAAPETTDRAVARLGQESPAPLFLWVHYFDPHFPYEPPEPFRSRFANQPYLGEVAAMDEQIGRLVSAFEKQAPGPVAVIIAGDHGEGLGDHGEAFHGNLLYESTMRVPLVIVGPRVSPGTSATPVSIRRIFDTLLDWAGLERERSLLRDGEKVVLGEAMKPFLEYGWQPQVMAVNGHTKSIRSGRIETYDLGADPGELNDLRVASAPPHELLDYPTPTAASTRPTDNLSAADRQKLASLGYISGGAAPVIRPEQPRAADMAPLFPLLDRASTLFVNAKYIEVVPVLKEILSKDPGNLDGWLRLATAQSSLGRAAEADAAFARAAKLAPASDDVRLYQALHIARGKDWARAIPLLEYILKISPDRLPALEALAGLRERENRAADATVLLRRIGQLRPLSPPESIRLGLLAMTVQDTATAIWALESASAALGAGFRHDLELGAAYLAARRFADARDALDRVPASDPGYPMALFKRAQVSVLLNEPDKEGRIALARARADATTRELIAREKLFNR